MEPGLSGKSAAIVLAGAILGMTLQLTQGQYSHFGIALMAVALLIGISGMWLQESLREGVTRQFLGILIIAQLFTTLFAPADDSMFGRGGMNFTIHAAGFALVALATLAIATERFAKPAFIATLFVFAFLGVWTIHTEPKPFIDVHPMHTDASDAMVDGISPYSITVKDMYGPGVSHLYYPPGTVVDGRVQYGFPYMPLALEYSTPFYLAYGDPRYGYLLAMIVTAGLIATIRPDTVGMLLAGLTLFTPAGLYIVKMCWIEPLCAMLLVATVTCAIRYPKALPIALGLLLASKQYLPAAIGLVPLLDRKDRLTIAWKSVLVAAIVSLPLVLWDVKSFINSAILYHMKNPFRRDSLSFVAWWASVRPGWSVPFWLSFVALGGAMTWCLARMPRSTQSFVAAFAFCFFVFVSLSKQAFINYHYLIVVAAFAAAATEKCMSGIGLADNTLSDHAQAPGHPLHLVGDQHDRTRPARAA